MFGFDELCCCIEYKVVLSLSFMWFMQVIFYHTNDIVSVFLLKRLSFSMVICGVFMLFKM